MIKEETMWLRVELYQNEKLIGLIPPFKTF